ncbi:MAG: hypothetical protein WAU36_07310 [Cyclobacteriaceae bacterium]
MKAWYCILFSTCFFLSSEAQLHVPLSATHESNQLSAYTLPDYSLSSYRHKSIKPKPSSIWLAQTSSYTGESGSTYWTGNITTQSYGKGKWGTFYYWDVQGNLRDMKGFIDIAGKNKRGLKLVFPWR